MAEETLVLSYFVREDDYCRRVYDNQMHEELNELTMRAFNIWIHGTQQRQPCIASTTEKNVLLGHEDKPRFICCRSPPLIAIGLLLNLLASSVFSAKNSHGLKVISGWVC